MFRGGGFDVAIGNPPWGADISKHAAYLEDYFSLAKGQYDSYELFIELFKWVLKDGGVWGFVIPDSIFKPEHMRLRKLLCAETQIDKIIKLGEGFFEGVFRASVIIIFRKKSPPKDHKISVFALMKPDRMKLKSTEGEIDLSALERAKGFLIPQERFLKSKDYAFDISSTQEDEQIMRRMESNICSWDEIFDSGRGVEFSEIGQVIQCPNCFKWDNPPRKRKGKYREKICTHCGHSYDFDKALAKELIIADHKVSPNHKPFITGEAVNRYHINKLKFIDTSKDGINYKEQTLYTGPKLLIRKTGVGIYATIDQSDAYTPQAVFIFKLNSRRSPEHQPYALEYFLGLLNSRLMLYYYYKKFGEVEWKSFPYVTQKTIKQLPMRKINFKNAAEKNLHDKIAEKVRTALEVRDRIPKKLDYEIENLVMQLYDIKPKMKTRIWDELKKVQKLRIIRELLIEG